jgi:hypothetical protein
MNHVLMHLLPVRLGDGAPHWLAEGMAQYAEIQALPTAERAAKRAELTKQQLARLTRLPGDDEAVNKAISLRAVEQLIVKAGVKPVTEYYRQVARRGYNDAARDRLMQEYTGFTAERLVESVRGSAG